MAGKVTTLSFGVFPTRPPPPVLVRFYNGHNDKLSRTGSDTLVESDRCSCCPYGFHIDRDFVPFTKNMLSREADASKLQELRSKLRSQRKSMDKLLGVPVTRSENWKYETLSRASVDVWKSRRASLERESDNRIDLEKDLNVPRHEPSHSTLITDTTSGDECCLQAAVQDFENCLTRTKPGPGGILSYTIPDSSKFHTFPRLRPATSRSDAEELQKLFSNSNYRNNEQVKVPQEIPRYSTSEAVADSSVPGDLRGKPPPFSRSSSSYIEGAQLETRIRELEEQLKLIPELQVKVTLLTEEKRQVMKLLDSEKRKRASVEELVEKLSSTKHEGDGKGIGDSVYRKTVCDNDRGHQPAVGTKVTRDTGNSPIHISMRCVGVGEEFGLEKPQLFRRADSYSPTSSLTGTKRRRIRSIDTGVQVTESDLGIKIKDPVLQISETEDIGVQVQLESSIPANEIPVTPTVKTKHVGVVAKPRTLDVGINSKPNSRDYGINPIVAVKNTKSVGIMVRFEVESKSAGTQRSNDLNTTSYKLPNVMQENNFDSADMNQEAKKQLEAESKAVEIVPAVKGKGSSSRPETLSQSPPTALGEIKPTSKIPRLSTPTSPKADSKNVENVPLEASSNSKDYETHKQTENIPELPAYEQTNPDSTLGNRASSDTSDEENLTPDRGTEEMTKESSSDRISSTPTPHEKRTPNKELMAALKVLNDALLRGRTTKQVTAAISIILREWFQVAGTKTASPADVEDYLDIFEGFSPQLLRYIVNMPDGNGNTAMHYAVSHGNFDVVSILLDSKVCDPNKANKAGYTSVMLVSLAKILSETHRQVVRRLFSMGDVNIKAAQHGQTALMLAASHGRLDTVRLLLEAGAAINIQDEDGSTALMCASEHGHGDIVKYFLTQPDCDPHINDNDGSNALGVAMEAGHKDIGVMLYAHMHFVAPNNSPTSPSSLKGRHSRNGSSSASPISTGNNSPKSPSHKAPK